MGRGRLSGRVPQRGTRFFCLCDCGAMMKARTLDHLLDEFASTFSQAPGAHGCLVGKPDLEVDKFFVAWSPGQLEGIVRRSTDGGGSYVAYLGGLDERLRCLLTLSLRDLKGFVIRYTGPGWRYHSWGVSAKIAKDMGVADAKPVLPVGPESDFKIVTFAPHEDISKIRESLFSAGAGRYGLYSKCSFSGSGRGTFLGGKGSEPARGQAGKMEEVAEERLEVPVPFDKVGKAVSALRRVHPYEHPVIEAYQVGSEYEFGEGRMGTLGSALAASEVSRRIASVLGSKPLYISSDSSCREVIIWDGDPEQGLYETLLRDVDLYVGPDSHGLAKLMGRGMRTAVVEFPRYCFLMAGAKELIYIVREKSKREAWGLRTFLPSKAGKEGVHT